MNVTNQKFRMDNESDVGLLSEVSIDSSNITSYKYHQSWRDMSDVVYGIISAFLIPCICSGNFLVLISLWKFPKLRTKTNIFVANLSIADSIMGAVSIPMYTAFFFNREKLEKYKYMCISKYSIVVFSSSASLLSLVAIAVDRYIAVIHPLRYHMIVTHKRIKCFLIGQWTYDLVTFTIPYFWNNYDLYQSCNFYVIFPRIYSVLTVFVSIAICLVVSLYLYIRIFLVARRHRRRLNIPQLTGGNNDQQLRKDAKSAKIMALILFLFFIFWLPFLLVGPIQYLGVAEDLMVIFKNITLLIAMSNSMVNPIVYCWLRRDFTIAFKRLCCSCNIIQKRNGVMEYSIQSNNHSTKSNSEDNHVLRSAEQSSDRGRLDGIGQLGVEIIAHRRLD